MQNNGLISACTSSGCSKTLGQKRCCDFQQGNYIVMYPGELEKAKEQGLSTEHLQITDYDYFGGKKVVCHAKDTASCDKGFKPLDCMSYPLLPVVPLFGEIDMIIKGEKCPLHIKHLAAHAKYVLESWKTVIADNPDVGHWLNKIEVVGYSKPTFVDDK